ncbi:MAG TPA: PadR family transcriptional regulator [Alphaproteobacteria bacterium]|nr:PadR family transcriptional regulator [Alphaproteobacteria bacterium]
MVDKKISVKKTSKFPKHVELKGFLSFFILHELNRYKLTGDDLAKVIGSRRGTVLTPGTIYPALKRLRKLKLVAYRKFGRRKVYVLTPLGKRELDALYSVFRGLFSGFKSKIK